MTNLQAHRTLLERYKARGMKFDSAGGWSGLREDGYIHEHLCWHLEKAGEFDQIVTLLQEETVDGHNAWYEVREGLAQTGGYIADLLRAWELTREQSRGYVERGEPIATLALEVRFALMLTSLNSMAANLPDKLVGHLVRYGVWKPEVALAHIRRIPQEKDRCKPLRQLAISLAETDRGNQALAVVQEISVDAATAIALQEVAPHLDARQLRMALDQARSIEDASSRIRTLVALAPHITPKLFQEALTIARGIEGGVERARLLSEIALALTGEERVEILTEAFTTSAAIEDCWDRTRVQAMIVRDLEPSPLRTHLLRATLTTMQGITTEAGYGQVVGLLMRCLTAEEMVERTVVCDAALAYLRQPSRTTHEIDVLKQCALFFNFEQRQEALAILHKSNRNQESKEYSLVLARLASGSIGAEREALITQALSVIRKIVLEKDRSAALSDIGPYLTGEQVQTALEIARELEEISERARACLHIAYFLDDEETFQEALSLVRMLPSDDSFSYRDTLMALIPSAKLRRRPIGTGRKPSIAIPIPDGISRTELARLLEVAHAMRHPFQRASALRRIAAISMPSDVRLPILLEALSGIRSLCREQYGNRDGECVEQLASLSASFIASGIESGQAEGSITLGLEVAREISFSSYRAEVLTNAVPALDNQEERRQVLLEALQASQEIGDDSYHALALRTMAPLLTEAQLAQALAMARQIENEAARSNALTGIALALIAPGNLDRALTVAREIPEATFRVTALARIAATLPSQELHATLLHEALQQARTYEGLLQVNALIEILSSFSPDDIEGKLRTEIVSELLAIGAESENTTVRSAAIRRVAPYLTLEQLQETVASVQHRESDLVRARIWISLIPVLVSKGRMDQALALVDLVKQIEEKEREKSYRGIYAEALVALVPYVSEEKLDEIVTYVCQFCKGTEHGFEMLGIVNALVQAGKTDRAIAMAQEIEGEWHRSDAHADIAVGLAETGQVDEALTLLRAGKTEHQAIHRLSVQSRALFKAAPHLEQPHISARLKALLKIVPCLPTREESIGLLGEIISLLAETTAFNSDSYHDKILQGVAARLSDFPVQDTYPLWTKCLEMAVLRSRKPTQTLVASLIPALQTHGTESTVLDTLLAMQDVMRWWP